MVPGSLGAAYVLATVAVTVVAAIRGVWSPCGLSMISSINPLSERSRGHRYWLTAGWFVLGAVVGGLLLGTIGAIGALALSPFVGPVAVTAALATVCCLITAAGDTSAFGVRLPTNPRQVNERWLGRYRRWVYAAGFGAQIGAGLATYIMTAAVYLVPVLGALSGSWLFALSIGLIFGLVRGLAVLISSRADTPGALLSLHRRLEQWGPWSRRAAIAVQLSVAAIFGFIAGGWPGVAVVSIAIAIGAVSARRARTTRLAGSGIASDRPAMRGRVQQPMG